MLLPDVPPELLLEILGNLQTKDLNSVALVCKGFRIFARTVQWRTFEPTSRCIEQGRYLNIDLNDTRTLCLPGRIRGMPPTLAVGAIDAIVIQLALGKLQGLKWNSLNHSEALGRYIFRHSYYLSTSQPQITHLAIEAGSELFKQPPFTQLRDIHWDWWTDKSVLSIVAILKENEQTLKSIRLDSMVIPTIRPWEYSLSTVFSLDSATSAHRFPRLQNLRLGGFHHFDVAPGVESTFGNLRVLDLWGIAAREFLHWLASGDALKQLEHLLINKGIKCVHLPVLHVFDEDFDLPMIPTLKALELRTDSAVEMDVVLKGLGTDAMKSMRIDAKWPLSRVNPSLMVYSRLSKQQLFDPSGSVVGLQFATYRLVTSWRDRPFERLDLPKAMGLTGSFWAMRNLLPVLRPQRIDLELLHVRKSDRCLEWGSGESMNLYSWTFAGQSATHFPRRLPSSSVPKTTATPHSSLLSRTCWKWRDTTPKCFCDIKYLLDYDFLRFADWIFGAGEGAGLWYTKYLMYGDYTVSDGIGGSYRMIIEKRPCDKCRSGDYNLVVKGRNPEYDRLMGEHHGLVQACYSSGC